MNDNKQYDAAVQTFLLEAEALSQDQIDALTSVDETLGKRAVAKRAAAQTKAAEGRHRAAMGEPPAKTKNAEAIADLVIDEIVVSLAKPGARIKALEASNSALAQRCFDLESRLVGLEMQLTEIQAHADR